MAPFVLLLRTFGKDGATRVGNPKQGEGYAKDTLESTFERVANEFDLEVRALHDEEARFLPRGVDYYSTSNEEWFEHFTALMRRAHAIIVFSRGSFDTKSAFHRELTALASESATHRVAVVFPPGLNRQHHASKAGIFDALGWPSPPALPLVAWRDSSGRVALVPSLGADDDGLADQYQLGLREAFSTILNT
jgi:hypothetical protein